MRKLYGDSLRKDAGFVKVMKSVASKNAKMFESHAQKHAPELRKVAREVIGKFDRVYEEAADAVEDFMSKCKDCFPVFFTLANSTLARPRISGVVHETRILIQQSRERFVIPWDFFPSNCITTFADFLVVASRAIYPLSIPPNIVYPLSQALQLGYRLSI